jgi:hypothetical protein
VCEAHEIERDLWPNFVKEARATERHWLRLLPTYNKTSSGQHWKPTGSSCIDTIYTKQDSQDSIVKEKKRERERKPLNNRRCRLFVCPPIAILFVFSLFSGSTAPFSIQTFISRFDPPLSAWLSRQLLCCYIYSSVRFLARSLSQIILGLLFLGSVSIRLQFLPTIELS